MKWNFQFNKSQDANLFHVYHANAEHAPNLQMITAPRREYKVHSYDAKSYEKVLATIESQTTQLVESTLFNTLLERKTSWEMSSQSFTLEHLKLLLAYSFGKRNEGTFRTYPSGGQFYAVEVYFVPTERSIENGEFERAVYKFNIDSGTVVKLFDTDVSIINTFTASTDVGHFSFDRTQFIFFFVANFEHIEVKYMSLSYRLLCLECGHMAQNTLLVATALKFSVVPIGGFHNRRVSSFLKLSNKQEPLYMIVGG